MRLHPRQRKRPVRYGTPESDFEIDVTINLTSMRQEERILSKQKKVSMFDRNWTISWPSFGTKICSVVNEFRRRGYFVRKKDSCTFLVYWCSEHPGKIAPCSDSCDCRKMLAFYFDADGAGRADPGRYHSTNYFASNTARENFHDELLSKISKP